MLILPAAIEAKELPDLFQLGQTNAEVTINTSTENRNAAISLAEQADYSIDIFTQDLDALLYDNEILEKRIADLARKHPNSRIRILVKNSSRAVRNSHRLIRLAQNLTSSVLVRKPSLIHQAEQCEFMVVDTIGVLHRVNTYQYDYEASVNFYSPQRARKLESFFNEAWDYAEEDDQVRRLYV